MAETQLMQAEVIAVGDELASGQRLDTNSQWLSARLGELGIATVRHTTIGDNLADNMDAFVTASQRSDVVIITGGLGPTQDDLTRQALAEAFNAPLELDDDSLRKIECLFARRQRPMPERNRLQAMFPRGSRVIANPHGSAPGIDLTVQGQARASRLFALPGVPAEMKQMWHESVAPRLEETLGAAQGRLRQHVVKLFGIGESDVEVYLPDLIQRGRVPTVGITVSRATITLRVAARAHSEEQFLDAISPTLQEIHRALGDWIFGAGDDELEHAVLRQLAERQMSMASVEIGAASLVSDWMLQGATATGAESSAANSWGYMGGIAFPSLASAELWFSGSRQEGESVWQAVAEQARRRFNADVALVVGCYPTQAAMETATEPFVFTIAIATAEGVTVEQRSMGGHPDVLGPRLAKTGLDLLRRKLISTVNNSTVNNSTAGTSPEVAAEPAR